MRVAAAGVHGTRLLIVILVLLADLDVAEFPRRFCLRGIRMSKPFHPTTVDAGADAIAIRIEAFAVSLTGRAILFLHAVRVGVVRDAHTVALAVVLGLAVFVGHLEVTRSGLVKRGHSVFIIFGDSFSFCVSVCGLAISPLLRRPLHFSGSRARRRHEVAAPVRDRERRDYEITACPCTARRAVRLQSGQRRASDDEETVQRVAVSSFATARKHAR